MPNPATALQKIITMVNTKVFTRFHPIWSFNTKIVTNHFQQNVVIYLAARIKIMPGNDRIPTRLRVIT